MANEHSADQGCSLKLILVPSLITLAVTILRLVGELQHWSPLLFSRAGGGGFALIGISWLPPIFGIYFALKLAGSGARPGSLGKAALFTLVGLLVMFGGGVLLGLGLGRNLAIALGGFIVLAATAVIPMAGWPALTKTLIAYGYAARIPVAIIMFLAMQGNWGTHYDVVPAQYAEMPLLLKYLEFGLLPQLVLWIAFTVITGSLLGIIAVALFRRPAPTGQATS
jgi:hypothetical protein